jgi:hypothetical protein
MPRNLHALPNIEVFEVRRGEIKWYFPDDSTEVFLAPGWFWWPCFPGCLPDGDPVGPFASEDEALRDAAECGGLDQ